jgi:hypothetical protein
MLGGRRRGVAMAAPGLDCLPMLLGGVVDVGVLAAGIAEGLDQSSG